MIDILGANDQLQNNKGYRIKVATNIYSNIEEQTQDF